MKQIITLVLLLITFSSRAQQSMSLQECYNLMAKNYPLIKQSQLLKTQHQFDAAVVSSTKLPQLSLDAQATYQSDVINIPIPNSKSLNKDQYRATLSVNQLIYNGGVTDASLKIKSVQLKTKQKQIEVSLYQLKQQINQLYFSILLYQEADALLKAKKNQVQSKLKEVRSGIKNGVILPSSDTVLEVELLKINQQFIALESNKSTLIETLSSLIGKSLDATTLFQNPLEEIQLHQELTRPELDLFQLKKEEIKTSEAFISKQNSPKLVGFATGGYGNPGLNMLDNSFQTFYTIGVKLKWNLFDWNTSKNQQKSLAINKDLVDNEIEIFKLNTNIELNKQQKNIQRLTAIIDSDAKIINLRKEVLKTLDSQLKNGIVTSSAYITEITNLYEAENTLVKHQTELQLAKANYNVLKGQ